MPMARNQVRATGTTVADFWEMCHSNGLICGGSEKQINVTWRLIEKMIGATWFIYTVMALSFSFVTIRWYEVDGLFLGM